MVDRLTFGRPQYFPSLAAWLTVGLTRSLRGVLAALVGTWFGVPVALLLAVVCGVVFGAAGLMAGLLGGAGPAPDLVAGVPVLGAAVESLFLRTGGMVGALVGALLGLVFGLLLGLFGWWVVRFADDPVAGFGSALGLAATGLLVGLVYTGYRVVAEFWLLRISGARRLSRREAALLVPIVRRCAARLGLSNHPPVLIDDSREPNAIAYTRHIVINQGLLDEFRYDVEVIAAVLCHELVHWRNGDAVSTAFVRGVALPLYLVHAGAGWLIHRSRHPVVTVLVWAVLWPVLVTVRYLILPMQAVDARRAEFRADQGAVMAGHRAGLRRVIGRLRRSFEAGRNGWTRAVCAHHPPHELRLERLEEPGRSYPLPEVDRPAYRSPVSGAGSLLQD